jgi:hypothetical protein
MPGHNLALIDAATVTSILGREFDFDPDHSAGAVEEGMTFTVFPTDIFLRPGHSPHPPLQQTNDKSKASGTRADVTARVKPPRHSARLRGGTIVLAATQRHGYVVLAAHVFASSRRHSTLRRRCSLPPGP